MTTTLNKQILDKDGLITLLAQRADFTKGDVAVLLDVLIEVFEDCVRDGTDINVREFGNLYVKTVSAREVYDRFNKRKVQIPSTKRATFRLSKNIRFAYKS